MAIVLPIAVNSRLVGSAVLVGHHGSHVLFATSLHLFGAGADIRVAIPPHQGNCRNVQTYPLDSAPTLNASVVATEPFADLAIVAALSPGNSGLMIPKIVEHPGLVAVGEEVVVLGYPFAPIGSLLQTWTPAYVTALGWRRIAGSVGVDELILSCQAHIGISGSAVVTRKDGLLCGIVRGSLAPPEAMRIGDIPVGSDTSVTMAPSAHLVPEMVAVGRRVIDRGTI